jgi:type I restriction enzyme S subunit
MSTEIPVAPREISLKDAVEFIVDNRGKTAPTVPKGIALIATNCVNNVDLYPLKLNLRYVSQETYDTWFRAHPVPGDILLTNKGSQNGAICLVPNPVDFCIAQDMVALRADPQKISPLYLFAALRSDLVQRRIKALNVDAVIPHLKKTDFNKLLISLPDREVQDSVGELYFELSSRIELLRETNATLEGIAQALFKSWFVDFDPVRANIARRSREGGNPDAKGGSEALDSRLRENDGPLLDEATARLFPDSFEESALGLVPREWRVLPIGDAVEAVGGATPDTKTPAYWEPAIHCWTTPKDLSGIAAPVLLETERKLSDQGLAKIGSGVLPVGTLLLSSRAPIGYLALAQVPLAINQGYIAMPPGGLLPPLYMLFWCRQNMEVIKGRANGSTFMEISKKAFRPIPALVPSPEVVQAFAVVASALFDRLIENEKQAQTLATLRDTLLPHLISGQLRLPQALQEMEGALP